ncbi:acetyl-CoA carboxylase biotin carboxyl carrier protein [Sagittula sp. S175]|uniref:acetyl-CoA carboxylase biotin carboxyl carrier protein n=1 Tax=Sagittula sp. S175 TaxID=3415129 RepID=UPI003C7B57A0
MSELTRDDIDYILKLIDGSSFDELKLEMGDLKLELRKPGAAPAPAAPAAQAAAAPTAAAAPSAPSPAAPASAPKANPEGLDVPAPLLGTFYHAAKPGAAPFVQVGDRVQPDTVIGIIEVMKLMNQVEAGIAGIVTEITASNGELVEHGQCLLRVKPA